MVGKVVLDTQYPAITADMWTILTLVFYAVYPAQAIVLYQETGAIHIHKKSNAPLHKEYFPLLPDDVEATKTGEAYLKHILPKFDTRIKKSVNSIILFELNTLFTLALYNFVVKGFRRAKLDGLVIRMNNSRVDFNASIPFLSVGGTVFMHGVIDDHNFTTVGNLSTFSDDIKIKGILNIQKLQLPSQQSVLQITDADIKIDIGNIDYKLIEELEEFKLILVQFMNKPVDDIIKSVTRAAVKLVNEKLAKIPADTVTKFLLLGWSRENNGINSPLAQRRSPYLRRSYPNYRYGY